MSGSAKPLSNRSIAVAPGDGVGPEITEAVLRVLEAAQVPLDIETVQMGESAYLAGESSGIPQYAWDALRRHRVLLKGPMTTPQGKGYKSVNVTLRKSLGLFANVRQCKAYSPFVASHHPGMNLVIVRENEEDLYAGIEHQQTDEVVQCLKLVTRPGSESVIRYAFEYARAYGRKRVTCMTKDNIMKMTDGLFHRIFDEVAPEYPDIEASHEIIDIGAARVAAQPERYDVIVTLNLYGDILSDIAAQVAGSVGLAGSTNVGRDAAMFEAVHGSAPDIAGKGVANPSGLLVAATQMLVHLGLSEDATRIKNAWLRTLEDGIHTADIHREGLSVVQADTRAFTDAIIERLGQQPERLQPVAYAGGGIRLPEWRPAVEQPRELVGVDVFLDWKEHDRDPQVLGHALEDLAEEAFDLRVITNRGVRVYPDGIPETLRTDHWRCRFLALGPIKFGDVLQLLGRISASGFEVIKTEQLYQGPDGERRYSLAQGE
ncbi:MAG: NADP-dependent isocitrate dehydrogenase [Myxococcota bacterium]|nr:NADP-dependent isocitrate dehydrogenase [Myxococcota bacterium]